MSLVEYRKIIKIKNKYLNYKQRDVGLNERIKMSFHNCFEMRTQK